MSQEIKDSLMYDFHHNLFVVKTMLPNVKNERETVVRWLRVLKNSGKTVDEMKLRNDFMYYLVLGVQEGSLRPPFDKPPPNLPLMSMVSLLPGADDNEDPNLWASNSGETFVASGSGGPTTRRPEIDRRSPDGGDFLAAQPIPDVGAFCYLAVVTKKRKEN